MFSIFGYGFSVRSVFQIRDNMDHTNICDHWFDFSSLFFGKTPKPRYMNKLVACEIE